MSWAASSPRRVEPANGSDDPQTARLEPGRLAVFSTAADGSLSVGIAAHGWNQAGVLVEAGWPANYAIISPDGSELQSGTVEQAGWLVLSFPTRADGVYRLQVHAALSPPDRQVFRIRAELLPFTNVSDGKLAEASALYTSAEASRNSLRAADVHDAITKYGHAAAAWQSIGYRDARILAVSGEALAWLELCQYRNAITVLDRALASLPPGSGYFRSWLLSLKAEVFLGLWDHQAPVALGAQALRIARSLNDPELEAMAHAVVGGAEFLIHASSAGGDLDEALRLANLAGRIETVAEVLRYKAWIEEDQGHLTQAVSIMQEAEDAFQKAGDHRKVLQTMPYLADIVSLEGDRYSSMLRNSGLLAPVMASGDVENYGNVLGNLGADYAALNRDRDAISYLQRAVQAYESIHHDLGISVYRGLLCMAELRQERLNDAQRNCEESARLGERTQDPKRLAINTWRLGKVRQAFGQNELAMEYFKRAATISAQVSDPRFESQALIDWGDAVESGEGKKEALPLFEKALALSQRAEDQTVQQEARFRIARWHANAGENAAAIRDLKIALDRIETQRSAVQNEDLRASYLAAVRKCHQLYVDILMREREAHPESASDVTALEISESARARTLLDSIGRRESGQAMPRAGEATAERIKLRTTIDQSYDRRLKLMLEGGHNRELEENSAALTQAIDSLQRMDDAERDEAKQIAPTARSMTAREIVEASKSLPVTMFEYALGATQSYLWVVHNGAIQSYIIPFRQQEIETLVKRWRELAATNLPRPGDDIKLARISAELSCKLIDPFIEEGMEKLAIVPDGELALLSFAALPVHGCAAEPGPPLITAHQVVMIPSFSTFLVDPGPKNPKNFAKDVAVLADPVFDPGDNRVHPDQADPALSQPPAPGINRQGPAFSRLAGTAQEASGIADAVGSENVSLFLGFNASVDTILSPAMRDYRILHLATHGVLDSSAPGLSGLVLSLVSSDGRPVPGYLKVQDIAGLKLSSELVVLSSCDSGAGDDVGGEGMTGLAHAFLQAGATRVVSSLWSVDDETTRQLMVEFYREMFLGGADPAEALRRSQGKMMTRPRRSAPYYWAGFEITSIGH